MNQVQASLTALDLQQQPIRDPLQSIADFPVQTLAAVKDICGVSTQLVVSFYADLTFVIVSQLGSIGSLVQIDFLIQS